MGTVADSKKPSRPAPDYRSARQTVAFLGRRLRVQQYRMIDLRNARRDAEYREYQGLDALDALRRRIQRELDTHPGLYAEIAEPVEGGEDGSSN